MKKCYHSVRVWENEKSKVKPKCKKESQKIKTMKMKQSSSQNQEKVVKKKRKTVWNMVENLDKNLAYVSAKADDRMGYKPSKRRLRGAFTILMETVGTLPKTPLRKSNLLWERHVEGFN